MPPPRRQHDRTHAPGDELRGAAVQLVAQPVRHRHPGRGPRDRGVLRRPRGRRVARAGPLQRRPDGRDRVRVRQPRPGYLDGLRPRQHEQDRGRPRQGVRAGQLDQLRCGDGRTRGAYGQAGHGRVRDGGVREPYLRGADPAARRGAEGLGGALTPMDDEGPPPSRVRPFLPAEPVPIDETPTPPADARSAVSGLRPYLLTGGRVDATQRLQIETQVVTTDTGTLVLDKLTYEQRDIVALCTRRPLAVAEVAA